MGQTVLERPFFRDLTRPADAGVSALSKGGQALTNGYAFLQGMTDGGGYVVLRGKQADGSYLKIQGKVA